MNKEFTERDIKAVIEKSMIVITYGLMISLLILLLFLFGVSRLTASETSLVSNSSINTITESYNTDLTIVESDVSMNENLYTSKNMEQYMSLDKRGWSQDAVDGAITMFVRVSTNVFSALIVGCTPTFLDYLSIAIPQVMVLRVSVCAWSLGIAALMLTISTFDSLQFFSTLIHDEICFASCIK